MKHFKKHPDDLKSKNRLRGLLIASRQSEPTKFEGILNLVRNASTTYTG